MNILEIIQEAAARNDEPTISNAFSTTNEQAIKYLASANKMAREITQAHDWAQLRLDYSFDTVVDEKAYDLPEDFKSMDSYYIYNNSRQYQHSVEDNDRALNQIARKVVNWTDVGFRLIREQLVFTIPAPTVDNFTYTYNSNAFAKNTNGSTTFLNKFRANEDTFLLDDELLILGIVVDVRSKYGYDITRQQLQYNNRLEKLMSKDKGKFISMTYRTPGFVYPSKYRPTGGDCY